MTAPLGTINSTDIVEGITPAQYLDTTHSPVALYDVDGDLVDGSGNALDLTWAAGTEIYGPGPVTDGLALFFQNSRASHAFDALYQILTDLTLEALVFPGIVHSADGYVMQFGGNGETEALNILWSMILTTGNRVKFLQESGAGTNQEATFDVSIPLGQWSHVALTRDNAGTDLNLYVNGILRGNATLGAAPTGGGSSILTMGQFAAANQPYTGMVSSAKIIAAELNAAQILAEAHRALPFELRP